MRDKDKGHNKKADREHLIKIHLESQLSLFLSLPYWHARNTLLQRLSKFNLRWHVADFYNKFAPVGQDAGMGGKVSCDGKESEKGRDVMAMTGLDCGEKGKPLVAGKGEVAEG